MTEEIAIDAPAVDTPVAAPKAPRAAVLLKLTDSNGVVTPVYVYPMIRRGPQFSLKVNGEIVGGANTTFGEIHKSVFEFNGSCFGLNKHLAINGEYTFDFPKDYAFKPPMTRREEDARALVKKEEKARAAGLPWPPVKAAKVAKAGSATDPEGVEKAPESPPEGAETASEGNSSTPTENGPESASISAAPKGKKAKR